MLFTVTYVSPLSGFFAYAFNQEPQVSTYHLNPTLWSGFFMQVCRLIRYRRLDLCVAQFIIDTYQERGPERVL